MDDITIRLEHVDFLDCLNGLHVHLLESGLELLVIHACTLVHLLDLSSWDALASTLIVSKLLPAPAYAFILDRLEFGAL